MIFFFTNAFYAWRVCCNNSLHRFETNPFLREINMFRAKRQIVTCIPSQIALVERRLLLNWSLSRIAYVALYLVLVACFAPSVKYLDSVCTLLRRKLKSSPDVSRSRRAGSYSPFVAYPASQHPSRMTPASVGSEFSLTPHFLLTPCLSKYTSARRRARALCPFGDYHKPQ